MRLLIFIVTVLAVPLLAQNTANSACRERYTQHTEIDISAIASGAPPSGMEVTHFWGRQNVRLIAGETAEAGPILNVLYPKGSINPGNNQAASGGAGFELAFHAALDTACVRYRVRFPADFDFALGGKLPGLYGGDAPRGCLPAELARGFSARLMWRTNGAGELYLYAPDRSVRCGESVGRGAWTFPRDTWVTIDEQIVMNSPDRSDGLIRIWVDDRQVVERDGLRLRSETDIGINGLLFSTFFGGSDLNWASPKDQSVDFAGFELWEGVARP